MDKKLNRTSTIAKSRAKVSMFGDFVNEDESKAEIFGFFNQLNQYKIPCTKHISSDSGHKFLLLLDNIEEIISQDRQKFVTFIKEAFENCSNLSIVMCSYEMIGKISDSIIPTSIFIMELDQQNSVNLFMDNSEELSSQDILTLIVTKP